MCAGSRRFRSHATHTAMVAWQSGKTRSVRPRGFVTMRLGAWCREPIDEGTASTGTTTRRRDAASEVTETMAFGEFRRSTRVVRPSSPNQTAASGATSSILTARSRTWSTRTAGSRSICRAIADASRSRSRLQDSSTPGSTTRPESTRGDSRLSRQSSPRRRRAEPSEPAAAPWSDQPIRVDCGRGHVGKAAPLPKLPNVVRAELAVASESKPNSLFDPAGARRPHCLRGRALRAIPARRGRQRRRAWRHQGELVAKAHHLLEPAGRGEVAVGVRDSVRLHPSTEAHARRRCERQPHRIRSRPSAARRRNRAERQTVPPLSTRGPRWDPGGARRSERAPGSARNESERPARQDTARERRRLQLQLRRARQLHGSLVQPSPDPPALRAPPADGGLARRRGDRASLRRGRDPAKRIPQTLSCALREHARRGDRGHARRRKTSLLARWAARILPGERQRHARSASLRRKRTPHVERLLPSREP